MAQIQLNRSKHLVKEIVENNVTLMIRVERAYTERVTISALAERQTPNAGFHLLFHNKIRRKIQVLFHQKEE